MDINERLQDLESRIVKLESGQSIQAQVQKQNQKVKTMSLREFLNLKKPKTVNDNVLVIGYYLEHLKEFEAFNVDDIKLGFREAKIPLPSNLNDVVNKNIKKAYVMSAGSQKDGKKAWVLTATGDDIAEQGFESKE